MSNKNYRFSIKTKMYIFVVITILAVALGTSTIAFMTSVDQIDKYYRQAAADNARYFATFVDGDFMQQLRETAASDEFQQLREQAEAEDNEQPVEDYLKEHGLWEKYEETRTFISEYLENMDGIKYLYIVAHGDKNDKYDMYLVDDDETPIYETGYYEEREEELRGIDLTHLPEPTISNGDWGWLCSDFKPVYDSDGNCVCIVGCDFGMEDVMKERKLMLAYLLTGAVLFTALVLTGAVLFINKVVVDPLDAMTKAIKKFKPAENMSYSDAGVMALDIKSHDEINEIYHEIRNMQINTIDQLNDLSALHKDKLKAERDIEDKERQIDKLSIESFKDALTGVGNKAAYIKKSEEINHSISESDAEFAVVMIDMNNLKQINDAHGHRAGDLYIKGCCSMICEAFKHSPVFRIGGDEFVVILQGKDYDDRMTILEQLRSDYDKTYANTGADPWMRYSAAVGMSERSSEDMSIDFVFKRADKAMYENKLIFKKEYGWYR